jgi:hypothetical protein
VWTTFLAAPVQTLSTALLPTLLLPTQLVQHSKLATSLAAALEPIH